MKLKLASIFLLAALPSISVAGMWSTHITITSVQPLVDWNGGIIRIGPGTNVNPANCSNVSVMDFDYSSGTQESRSAVISAMYTAFASGATAKFYLDSLSCSAANAPRILGIEIVK